jgi:uncharacterized protein
MKASNHADVWVLLGPHKGDNNQILALAEGLGMPFRTIELEYSRNFSYLPAVRRAASITHLTKESRAEIVPRWPSLVLGIGQRSGPVARYIKKQSGGRSRVVRLGDPMAPPELFDLVITTTQYAVRDAPNVVRLPVTITDAGTIKPDRFEERWLEAFAHPRRLLVIGGKTSMWRFDQQVITDAVAVLKRRAQAEGGSIVAVTSPRTSPELVVTAQRVLGEKAVVAGPFPRYGALLSAADEIHVTGDSVSMLSDAVISGKPVGLVPLESNRVAGLVRILGAVGGRPLRVRDLQKFWDDLRARDVVGTIDEPRSGLLDISPMDTAIAAIHAVLKGQLPDVAPALRPTAAARVRKAAAQPAAG